MSVRTHNCKESGVVTEMASDIIQEYDPVTRSWEIIKFTCPYCGHIETAIDTHRHSISAAEKNNLEVLYVNAQVTE